MKEEELRAVCTLIWQTWPWHHSFEEAFLDFKKNIPANAINGTDRLRFVVYDEALVVAHASIFPRTIHTEQGSMLVGALSGVCTHDKYRRQGLGAHVVRAAFERVDQGEFPVSLWMTNIPTFYEKLGGRIIKNTWINTHNTTQPDIDPWPDELKMIYPANHKWPDGVIDLNGSVY